MADSKITALTALTSADPANDMIPIVDVSDTPPASGNTKRISINNLLACSPSATLASATITGDLTVNTNVLKVDSTNDRVGIGTASPAATVSALIGSEFLHFGFGANNDNYYTVGASGTHFWRNSSTTQMTLDSTGLGVGAGPSYKLDVTDNSTNIQARLNSSNNNGTSLRFVNTGTSGRTWQIGTGFAVTAGHFEIYDATAAVNRLSIDSSGNVGIAVSTFGTSAAKVLGLGTGTEPTTGPAGTVQFFTSTRSASNTIPAIFCEGSGVTNAGITSTTVTNKIAIKVNGTIYYLLATTSAA